MVDDGRGQGALSPSDRKYLRLGNEKYGKKYSRQSAHKRRKAIPTRIRNALFDFEYLADPDLLASDLFKDIIARREDDTDVTAKLFIRGEPTVAPEIEDALAELIAFVFRVAGEYAIEETVSDGVRRELDRIAPEAELGEVRIPIEDPETVADRALRRMDIGRPLTDTEVRVLLERDEVDPAEVAAHVRSTREPDDEE